MKFIRVALCLSGQMRAFRMCHRNLKKNILIPLKPDVFIHTWKYAGVTTKAYEDMRGEEITPGILDFLYAPKKAVIEDFKDEYSKELDGMRIPDILVVKGENDYKGQLPMFYKMYQCNKLKSQYEKEHGFKYDVVIRLRSDLRICRSLPKKIFRDLDAIWTEGISDKRYRVCDRFAISNSVNMDYYTSVWEHLRDYWSDPLGAGRVTDYRLGGQLMKHHSLQSRIMWRLFYIPCYVIRREKLLKYNIRGVYFLRMYLEMFVRNILEKYVRV